MTTVRGAAIVVGLTWIVAFTAILVAWAVTNSVGLQLTPVQLVLFMSGIALSLGDPGRARRARHLRIRRRRHHHEPRLHGRAGSCSDPADARHPRHSRRRWPGLVSLFILQIRPGELVQAAEEPSAAVEPTDADGPSLASRPG
jgi:hypothetical protein